MISRGVSNRVSALWIAPCIAAAIPLVMAPGFLYFYDVTPKVVLLYLGTAAALPFVNPRRLLGTATGRWYCAILAAAFLSLLVSSIFSVRPELSSFGTNWRRMGLITQSALLLFAFVVAADLSSGPERLRTYLRAFTMSSGIVAIYGIFQYVGWDPWLDPGTYHIGSGVWTIVRPPGTLGYVTYLANYLVFGAFQALALCSIESDRFWRWAGCGVSVLSVIAIVLSGTRAAWLALLVGALVFALLDRRRHSIRTLLMVAAVAVIAVVFYFSPSGLQLRSRMRWFREDPKGGARLYLWRDSLALVGRHWLIGSGPETFSIEFPQAQSRELSRAFPEFYHESAHNIFLDAGAAQGLPGLLILLTASAMALKVKRGPSATILLAGFTALLVCHQFSVFTVPTALAFWIMLAMLTVESVPGPSPPDRRMLWLLPVSLAFLVAAGRMTFADRHLARMRNAIDASHFDVAQAECRAAADLGMHADLWLSRKLLTASQVSPRLLESISLTQQALTSGISATTTADDPYNAWMNLGLVYAKLNNASRTEYCIRKAIAASPNWYKPHLALSQLLLATNRSDEGRMELRLANDLRGVQPPI